jgi:hypothetical protein
MNYLKKGIEALNLNHLFYKQHQFPESIKESWTDKILKNFGVTGLSYSTVCLSLKQFHNKKQGIPFATQLSHGQGREHA